MICLLIAAIPIIIFLLISLLNWSVHHSMVKDQKVNWDYSNFDRFIEEFNKKEWRHTDAWPKSWFNNNLEAYNENKIHASIIVFDGKGMILDYFSYIRFEIWCHKNRVKKSYARVKGLWTMNDKGIGEVVTVLALGTLAVIWIIHKFVEACGK